MSEIIMQCICNPYAEPDAERAPNCPVHQEIAALTQERDRLKESLHLYTSVAKGEMWYWQDDGEDHIESLTCPVVISADALRKLTKRDTQAAEAARLREVRITQLEALIGTITLCAECNGTRIPKPPRQPYCCPIGHARECNCKICQWRRYGYQKAERNTQLEAENESLKAALREAEKAPDLQLSRLGAGGLFIAIISIVIWLLTGTGIPFHPIFAAGVIPTSGGFIVMDFLMRAGNSKRKIDTGV